MACSLSLVGRFLNKELIMLKKLLFILSITTFFAALIIGCSDAKNDEGPIDNQQTLAKVNSCEGCHTNYEHLKKVYTPDPPASGGGGCGGDAPHYEPYDRVYLGDSGYEDFKASIHGKLECVACHNGTDNTDNKDLAHSGDFISHPSTASEEKCGTCHADIVARTVNSTHEQGWGQKSMVTQRYGLGTGPEKFDQLPELLKNGYKINCQKCHGSCGECHITRPNAGGGGLANGHKFTKTPDMRKNCTTCHVSRGGHAYYGQGLGTVPDVHLTKAGFTCMNCHSTEEIHGDGKYYDQRYKNELMPECSDCHSGIENSNAFHSTHFEDFNCQTCHSQDYNNCGSCHIGTEEGARVPSHQKFKIGMNPLKDEGIKPYRMATVRQSLSAPDSWKQYGVDNLTNFDVRPTYKYTTPHNIIRWTERTIADSVIDNRHPLCAQACHVIKNTEGEILNKQYYLFESDLQEYEMPASEGVIVDGKLPNWWQLN